MIKKIEGLIAKSSQPIRVLNEVMEHNQSSCRTRGRGEGKPQAGQCTKSDAVEKSVHDLREPERGSGLKKYTYHVCGGEMSVLRDKNNINWKFLYEIINHPIPLIPTIQHILWFMIL